MSNQLFPGQALSVAALQRRGLPIQTEVGDRTLDAVVYSGQQALATNQYATKRALDTVDTALAHLNRQVSGDANTLSQRYIPIAGAAAVGILLFLIL